MYCGRNAAMPSSPRCFLEQEAQSTLLLKKEQDMRIVDDALEYMKQEYRTRVEVRHVACSLAAVAHCRPMLHRK